MTFTDRPTNLNRQKMATPKEKKVLLPPPPKVIDEKYLKTVANARKKWLQQNNTPAKVLLFVIGSCIFGYLWHYSGCAALATLYMFAYNGKVSGRHDGNVLMANGRGRAYATPALVRNSYTMTARGILSLLSAGWRGLTQAEMASWNALQLPATNRLGQAITISGKDAYVRLNANLINVGSAPNTSAPTLADVPAIQAISAFTADASAGTLSITYSPTPTDTAVEHEIYATAPLSPGVFHPSRSAFRLVDVLFAATGSPYSFGTAYTNKFGAITLKAGSKIFIQLYGVENTTGQKIPSVGTSTVIVP